MKKKIFNQFVVYPIIFIALILFIFNKYPDNEFTIIIMSVATGTIEGITGIDFPSNLLFTIYGYFVGFAYGTLSMAVQARKIKAPLLIFIVFMAKTTASLMYGLLYGVPLFVLEIILLPFIFMYDKKVLGKKREEKKQQKVQQEEERETERLAQAFHRFEQMKKEGDNSV